MTKQLIFSFTLLALSATASAQTAAKTFSKSFNSENKGTLNLELPGTVEVKEWDNPSIKIEINIALPTGNTSMLNELANVGRYNMMPKMQGDALLIQMPNMQKQVRIKGETLKEQLTFVAFVPKSMKTQTVNTTLTLTASAQ